MRSCMYCGKTLEKNERCTCPQSVKAREAKNAKNQETKKSNSSDNVYTTGYTKKEKKKFRWHKKTSKTSNNMLFAVKSFLKDPVKGISSQIYLNPIQTVILILIESLIISLSCMIMAFRSIQKVFDAFSGGITGFVIREHNIADFLALTGLGMIIVIIGIFMFVAVFWGIDRLIIKRRTGFFDFAQKLVYPILFFNAFAIAGIIVGVFTVYASLIFNILGSVAWLLLTYEALKNEWNFIGASRVLYMMIAGVFIILLVLLNIFVI